MAQRSTPFRTSRPFPRTLTGLLAAIALAVLAALGTQTIRGQMSSCDEAQFHQTQGGVKSLDQDGDGVPGAAPGRP